MGSGPNYSYADELSAPSELGINRDGSTEGINRAVAGINYYVDAIGFGESSGMARDAGLNQVPLGLRYFMKTGAQCSNGADMYEYINTVPGGLQGRIGREIKPALGVDLRGLAPGIAGDAVSALNPIPLFQAVVGGGYAQCKKVTKPVGDMRNSVQSRYDAKNVWITDPWKPINGAPAQTRWVMDKSISQQEYDDTPKTEKSGDMPETGTAFTEGFAVSPENKVAAGLLFAVLCLGIVTTIAVRR